MKILALDSSTHTAGLAVMDDGEILAELSIRTGRKRGELLAPALDKILAGLGLTPADLEAYAVGIGPGSFTGLRGGLALIKGLALANPGPVAAVSSLHALAMNACCHQGVVLPVIDARKGEVFTALFSADGSGGISRQSDDAAISPERIGELTSGPALLLGDGLMRYGQTLADAISGGGLPAPPILWSPMASWVAALAQPRLASGEADPVDSLVPVYVRHSDAELKLGPRQ